MPTHRIKQHRSHLSAKEWCRFQAQYQESTDDRYQTLLCSLRKKQKAVRVPSEVGRGSSG